MDAPFFAPLRFTDPQAALAQVQRIYEAGVAHLRDALARYVAGEDPRGRVRAFYPSVRIETSTVARPDSRLAYGFVAGPGVFETTLTRPDLYARYYAAQFDLLIANHGVELVVGTSRQPIPVHFAFAEQYHVEAELEPVRLQRMRDLFDLPDLAAMDDGIANGTHEPAAGEPHPLALFTAPRVDYSLHRLRHYTGTSASHFQNYVLFTNYQFYIDEFVRIGRQLMVAPDAGGDGYVAFVEPGGRVTWRVGAERHPDAVAAAAAPVVVGESLGQPARTNPGPDPAADLAGPAVADEEPGDPGDRQRPARLPQMPAYHLVRADASGITMVNIGVGPANAKTITDHIAVLRPHAWIMLGHCAGLRNTQRLGDYVLAHGYVREDHVLDEDLPLWVPIPALAEIQVALEAAVADVTQLSGYELKRIMRTGTVASTDNRNWELLPHQGPTRRFSQSRAVALDMESATIAANGFRFRVPYGTLLCVSDKPLHGEIKLPGMANRFYRASVDQHLRIGMRAVELLRRSGLNRLHSRKLRSFAEVAFQ
jgi:AMP nucleosidase